MIYRLFDNCADGAYQESKRNFSYREGYTDLSITAQTGLAKKAKEASVIVLCKYFITRTNGYYNVGDGSPVPTTRLYRSTSQKTSVIGLAFLFNLPHLGRFANAQTGTSKKSAKTAAKRYFFSVLQKS